MVSGESCRIGSSGRRGDTHLKEVNKPALGGFPWLEAGRQVLAYWKALED